MTDQPYTDDDLRAEAARLRTQAARDADERIRPTIENKWRSLNADQIDEACDEVVGLLDSAVDVSRWAVDLGACGLRQTTELAWGRDGDAWDLAVQIAHRPGLNPELQRALVAVVRGAVRLALNNHGITDQRLLRDALTEENAS